MQVSKLTNRLSRLQNTHLTSFIIRGTNINFRTLRRNKTTLSSFSGFIEHNIPQRLRDIIRTGSLHPPNPITTNIRILQGLQQENSSQSNFNLLNQYERHHLPDFSYIQPRHFETALEEFIQEFQSSRQKFNHKLSILLSTRGATHLSYEEIMFENDQIDFALQYIYRLAELCLHAQKTDDMKQTYRNVLKETSNCINTRQSKEFIEVLKNIRSTLLQNGDVSCSKRKEERLRAIELLLRNHMLLGGELIHDQYKQFKQMQNKLEQMELYFSNETPRHGGNLLSTQESLPLMIEILSNKHQMSQMVGFENYAQWSMFGRMATIEDVKSLHDYIAEKALPWISSTNSKIVMGSINDEAHVPCFEFHSVLTGLFDLSKKLFGVEIKRANYDVDVWDSEANFFHAFDEETEKFLGSFYVDPYARPFKQGGNWMGLLLDKRRDDMKPLLFLSCYMNPPWKNDDSPIFMTFEEVNGLFHEFGHVLQFLLSEVELGSVSGTQLVEDDATEFISQFMEFWLYNQSTLSIITKHFPTEQDRNIISKLIPENNKEAAVLEFLQQICLGQLEIELHSNSYLDNAADMIELQNEIVKTYIPHNLPPEGDLSLLEDIFCANANGLHTCFYRYIWCKVMSADAYKAFEEVGMEKEEEIKRLGRKFRKVILEKGGGVHPANSFEMFRGRKMDPDVLLQYYGIL